MPYTIDSPNLPKYIANKPDWMKKKWIAIFNDVYDDKGENAAFIAANSWLKREMENKGKFVKRSVVKLELDTSQGFIKRSDDGEEYISLLLNGDQPHKDGRRFSQKMLEKWANAINNGDVVMGDFDHAFYDQVLSSSMTDEQVKTTLKNKPGIAKAIKAIIEDGKLWVRAAIDKRYRKRIQEAKGVSAEAFCTWEGDEAIDGDLLGFTFNLNTEPADSLAGVAI